MGFKVPDLPYAYAALEPAIDARTMEIHHQKHHGGYVSGLNKALESYPELQEKSIEALLSDVSALPEAIRQTVINTGGGHYNHSLFWESLVPGGSKPSEAFEKRLKETFGSFEAFQKSFEEAALKRFGSGWAWLVEKDGVLSVISSANQDAPISDGYKALLGLDVWEHAYYLNYQNRRGDYVSAFWSIVNWPAVEGRV